MTKRIFKLSIIIALSFTGACKLSGGGVEGGAGRWLLGGGPGEMGGNRPRLIAQVTCDSVIAIDVTATDTGPVLICNMKHILILQ